MPARVNVVVRCEVHLLVCLHFCWKLPFFPKLTDYSCFGCLTTSVANRFHVAVRLFSKISQMTSKCGKYKKEAHWAIAKCSLMFLPLFDVFCDLLLKRRTAIWNLLVYIIKIKRF